MTHIKTAAGKISSNASRADTAEDFCLRGCIVNPSRMVYDDHDMGSGKLRALPGALAIVLVASWCWAQRQVSPGSATKKSSLGSKKAGVSAPAGRQSLDEAKALFQQAAELVQKEQYAPAIPLLQKAVELAPNEGRIHHYLGYALWKDDQWGAARTEFEKALKLEPGNIYTEYFLARLDYQENRVDRAVQLFEAILASGTPLYDTYQRLGYAYFRQGNLPKALEMTQEALQQTPWDGALHFQLGKIYRQMGQLGEAQKEFETSERLKRGDQVSIQKLLELSDAARKKQNETVLRLREELLSQPTKDRDILLWLGVLLGQGEFYSEALLPLQQAVDLSPNEFEAHFNLGLTLVRLERYREAETNLRKAFELRPDSFEANSVLGVLCANQNRTREAIDRLRVARQVRPDNLRVLALLGQQYLQGRYIDEAIRTFREALRLKPDDANLSYLLIEGYQKNKEYDKALNTALETRKLFPGDARAHYEVGHQMANIGRYSEAQPFFEEALRLDPSLTAAHNSIADLQLRKGEYQAALESFRKARRLDPQNLDCLRGIGRTLVRLQQYQEAVTELEKAIQVHPDDAELFFQLAQAYSRLGEREKAAQASATFRQLRDKEIQKEDASRPRKFDTEMPGRGQ